MNVSVNVLVYFSSYVSLFIFFLIWDVTEFKNLLHGAMYDLNEY